MYGEQVAGSAGRHWLDEVQGDLEGLGYAVWPGDLPACSVGADHQRRRLWWVADADSARWEGHQPFTGALVSAPPSFAIARDPLARARRAVAGDLSDLLLSDGLSVVMERDALAGYGNAIVPQVAAEVIGAYMDICEATA